MSKDRKKPNTKGKVKKHQKSRKSDYSISSGDLKLLEEGKHYRSYEKFGAKIKSFKKKSGVQFVLWAPNAKAVSVVGEFNDWEPGKNKMNLIGKTGYWQLFIDEMQEGELYKFAVKSESNEIVLKSDPYAFRSELRPGNASITESLDNYKWRDKDWVNERKKLSTVSGSFKNKPISVYEMHAGSWKKNYEKNEWGYKNYKELAKEIVIYAKEMNFTHIELLPVMEHPLDISWGYQVVNFFAPTSRYGSPEEFMYFVDHCHQNNIGVILDWVPSHFPTDGHGLGNFDGREIYAYENPQKGFHKEWGTHVFDYGKNEVRNFLISNALFWCEKYHIDGLRVDAVASMLYLDYSRKEGEWEANVHGGNENLEAVSFLKELNETVHKKYKGVLMIAEESSSWPGVTAPVHLGGLGFDMKWNMGWMHDTLSYFSMDPVYRKFHHGKLTFSIWYAFSEKFLLPLSHDEVVHLKKSVIEKMPGDDWQKFANARLMYGFMFAHPGKKLNFMGNEIAQYKEWNSEESLDWNVLENESNKKFQLYFKELGRLYFGHSSFYEEDFESKGFQWIDFSDSDNSVIAFMRFSKSSKEKLLFTFNMTPVIRENYIFGVPEAGYYKEILNSDAEVYGGSGIGNYGGVESTEEHRFEFKNSIRVTLPPLAMNVYKFEELKKDPESIRAAKNFSTDTVVEISEIEKIPETSESSKDKIIETVDRDANTDVLTSEELFKDEINEKSPEVSDEIISAEDKSEKKGELTEEDMEAKLKEIMKRIKKF